jgi:hypothetical protein
MNKPHRKDDKLHYNARPFDLIRLEKLLAITQMYVQSARLRFLAHTLKLKQNNFFQKQRKRKSSGSGFEFVFPCAIFLDISRHVLYISSGRIFLDDTEKCFYREWRAEDKIHTASRCKILRHGASRKEGVLLYTMRLKLYGLLFLWCNMLLYQLCACVLL